MSSITIHDDRTTVSVTATAVEFSRVPQHRVGSFNSNSTHAVHSVSSLSPTPPSHLTYYRLASSASPSRIVFVLRRFRIWIKLREFLYLELVSLDGLHSGVPTRTTPTLTPTTLRSIEQTFLELTSESGSHSREAGFVPPLVEPSQPTPAQTQNTQNNNNVLLENQQSQSHQLHELQQQNHHQTRRNMGGRRPTRTIGMSPEEEERRQVRRERNKMAAARCRKRRMDHTNSLLEETEGLEQKKQSLQDEIHQLQQAKDELEFILEAHRAVCRIRSSSPVDVKPVIKPPQPSEDHFVEPQKRESVNSARPNRPNSLPVGFDNNNRPNSLPIFTEPKERPDSLQFKTVETPTFMKTASEVAGVPITTPSSGIPFNFDSLMEGGTGLTPVSTPLIPSCSSQQRNNLSAVDLSSPDANPPKLVSL